MSKICQKITKSLPVTFAWLTLLTCTGLVYGFVMPYIIQTYGYWILICEGVVFAFVVCNFMLSTFMDPGRYPKANEAKDSNAPMYKNVEIDNVAVSLKWCRTCKMYRPPRCTHCNECNSCIEVFDHHCPWVNNCIGRRNYRYFFQFLWLLIVHMLALFVILVVFVWQHRQNVGSRENIVSLCVSVVIGLLCWPISGLAVFHVMLVSRGRTTNEQVTGKAKSLGDVYDQGCCHNWKQSFCGPIWPRLVDRVNTSARVEEFPKSKRDATVVRYKAKEIKVSASNDPSTKEHLYSKMQVQPTRSTMATASMVEKFSAVPAFRPGIETGYPSVDKSCRGRGGLFPDRLQNFCGRKVVLVRSSSHQSTTTNIVPPQVTTNSNLQDKISSIINTLSPSKKLTSKEYESIRSGQAAASSPISEGSLVESSAGETSSPCEALQGLMVEADEDEEVVERTRSSSRHKHSTVTNILNLESCKEPSDGRPVLTNRKRTSLSNMICRQSRNIQLEDESCLKSLLTEESNNPSTPGSGSTKRRSFILSLFKGDAVGDKPPEEIRGYDNLDFDAGHLNVDMSLLEKSPTLSARSSSNTNNNNSNTLADEKTKEFHDSLLEGDFLEDAPSSDNQDRSHRNQQTKKAQQLSLLNSIFKPSGSQGSSYSRINPFYKVNPSYAFRPTSIAFGRSPVDPVPLLPSGAVPQVGNPAKLPGDNPVILTSSYYKSNANSFQSEASLPRLESRDGNPQEHTKSNKNFDNVHRNPDFRPLQLASLKLPEGAHEGAIKRPTSFLKAVKESDYLPPPCGKHFYTPQGPVAQTTDQRFHQNHSTSLGSLPNIIPKAVDKSGDSKPTVDTIRAPMASLSEEDFNSQVNLSSFEISV